MQSSAIERLAKAIGYPEPVPEGAGAFTFRVDGADIFCREADHRILLEFPLASDVSLAPALSSYAVGRILKEDAVIAWGTVGGAEGVFIWQDAPADAEARTLARMFESFMDSCDWWRARVDALRGKSSHGESATVDEAMVIRP